MILKRTLKKAGGKGVDWIHLANDRVTWPVLLNTIMNVPVN
jgi:hypothetical protein